MRVDGARRTAHAAHDLGAEVRLGQRARNQRRRGAGVLCVDLERRRAEEDEAAAALEGHHVAAARAQRFEAELAQLPELRRGAGFVETLGLDGHRDVSGGERDAARSRVVLGFERIVVGPGQQPVPERLAPALGPARVAREFDGDRRRGQADGAQGVAGRSGVGEDREPAQRSVAAANAHRDAVRSFAGRRQAHDAVAAPPLGRDQFAARGRHRARTRAGQGQMPPLGVFEEHGRVDSCGQVRGESLGTAARARDARQALGELD